MVDRQGRTPLAEWRLRVVSRLAMIGLSALLTVGIAEIVLRILDYDLNISPHWRFHRHFGWTVDPNYQLIDEVNPNGFRYREPAESADVTVRRAVVLGDSFAQASGVPYAASFPGLVEDGLNRGTSDRWSVMNLAVGDWGNGQQMLALRELALPHSPDLIILQVFPFNDLCNNSLSMVDTCSMQDYHRPYWRDESGDLQLDYQHPTRRFLRNHSLFFGLVEQFFSPQVSLLPGGDVPWKELKRNRNRYYRENARRIGMRQPGAVYALVPDEHQPEPVSDAWQITEQIIEEMAAICDRRGVLLVAVVIPYFRTLDDALWEAWQKAFGLPLDRSYDTSRFESMFQQLGVPAVSLRSEILRSDTPPSDLFFSDGHFNPLGHAKVASWILKTIVSQTMTAVDFPEVDAQTQKK